MNLLIFSDNDFLFISNKRHRARLRVQSSICVFAFLLLFGGFKEILLFEDVSWHLTMFGDSLDLWMRAVLLLQSLIVSEGILFSRL